MVIVGGGGSTIQNVRYNTGGAGSGGFNYVNSLASGTYSYTIGAGGNGTDGNSSRVGSYVAAGGKYSNTRAGGNGGNGGGTGGAPATGTNVKGGGGGDTSGNIGVSANGGTANVEWGAGGGANIVWGGASAAGSNAGGTVAGNGGGGGGQGASFQAGGGGGGGYLGGRGANSLIFATGGRGYGGGGVSNDLNVGGGGGGFDPRILYVYTRGNPNGFSWSSSAINTLFTSNGDSTSRFLNAIDASGRITTPAAATLTGNAGALFFVMEAIATIPVPCFVAGTQILTPYGYKPVEDLQSGDTVITSKRKCVPIKLYSFTIDTTTTDDAPYKISAGAFGPRLPKRDLCVSPRHAIKDARGIWQIPKYLANQNDNVNQYGVGETVTYYHIECPNYYRDNIYAEEVEVESYKNKQGASGVLYMWSDELSGWERIPPNKMPTVPKNPTTYMIFTI
jgi:hypothetical protein